MSLKLFTIGILILILLIPQGIIGSLINERENRSFEVKSDISSKWGERQVVGGPVLTLPFYKYLIDDKGVVKKETSYAHFLPENLNINGDLNTETRSRGIYDTVVYKTILNLKGDFAYPDIASLGLNENDVLWDKAYLSFGVNDMKGLNKEPTLNFDTETNLHLSSSQAGQSIFSSELVYSLPINIKETQNNFYSFSLNLDLNGSEEIYFMPLGRETNVSLQSSWINPSFDGSFLPDERNITKDGFDAKWKVLAINRNYPQAWINNAYNFDSNLLEPQESDFRYNDGPTTAILDSQVYEFGVKFLLPVDIYQKNVRSVKYAGMAIALTFLAFFFAEIFNKKRFHPIQYLLVGFAVSIFYLLLLSISEHLEFGYAYLISTVSTVFLVTLYAKAVFQNNKESLVLGVILTLIYGFFYTLLQLQDYSLLIGSIGIFLILALCMFMSRKIDWYGVKMK